MAPKELMMAFALSAHKLIQKRPSLAKRDLNPCRPVPRRRLVRWRHRIRFGRRSWCWVRLRSRPCLQPGVVASCDFASLVVGCVVVEEEGFSSDHSLETAKYAAGISLVGGGFHVDSFMAIMAPDSLVMTSPGARVTLAVEAPGPCWISVSISCSFFLKLIEACGLIQPARPRGFGFVSRSFLGLPRG